MDICCPDEEKESSNKCGGLEAVSTREMAQYLGQPLPLAHHLLVSQCPLVLPPDNTITSHQSHTESTILNLQTSSALRRCGAAR